MKFIILIIALLLPVFNHYFKLNIDNLSIVQVVLFVWASVAHTESEVEKIKEILKKEGK